MRRRAESTSEARSFPSCRVPPVPIYSHVSTYRSLHLELQLYSPSLKVHEDGRGPLAVFGEHDQVGGKVVLDPNCFHTGRLKISMEGAFLYQSSQHPSDDRDFAADEIESPQRKHVFFSSSTTISVSPNVDPTSRGTFRDFVRRRPSASCINVGPDAVSRSHPFTFYPPKGSRPGEEMPASFIASKDARSSSKSFSVSYQIVADWEPNDAFENPSHLEVPILLQPDADFQSADASSPSADSWLEVPLKSDRPMPYRCAVTLSSSVTFSRASSIPYFVVFTTTPRSPALAKEMAADSTVSVSLLRQITVTEQVPLPPTPPLTPSSDECESPRAGLIKRVARSTQVRSIRTRRPSDSSNSPREKPLPALPTFTPFLESLSLHQDLSIGFPKRPRLHCDSNTHPSLETQAALPDGLLKNKISLDKEMLPCIDWAGISVKYYLDVAVVIGQDDLRARVPIRIL